ncbi:hypothetical protein LCGC14_3139020 [marine sediment metagenome]|uniref:Ice-binding protein C-terminal domain-containing protein n=1 Tax=marine sediment metagenome TaxID=412755 RepID=A0A0F8YLT2_9ZZZZ
MKRGNLPGSTGLLAVVFLASSVCQASQISYDNRGSFSAATDTLVEERFETFFTSAQTVQFNGFSISVQIGKALSTTTGSLVSEGSRAVTDETATNRVFTIVFDVPTYAFGMDINDWGTSGGTHSLTASSDTGLNHVIASSPPSLGSGNTIFWGVVDSDAFNTITIDTGYGGDRIGIDYAEHSSVPEPATIGLLAFGGLALIRKRRSN